MKDVLMTAPLHLSNKKSNKSHQHIVTVAVDTGLSKQKDLYEFYELLLNTSVFDSLRNEIQQSPTLTSLFNLLTTKNIEAEQHILLKNLFNDSSVWKKTKDKVYFNLDDFHQRVRGLFNYQLYNNEIQVLELSSGALNILNGLNIKLRLDEKMSPSLILEQKQESLLSLQQEGSDISVQINQVLLTLIPSGICFINFYVTYKDKETSLCPNFGLLAHSVKQLSTAQNRGFQLTQKVSPLVITEDTWDEISKNDSLTEKVKSRKLSQLANNLVKTECFLEINHQTVAFNLTQLAYQLVNLDSKINKESISKVRLHSFFTANIDEMVKDSELDYLGNLFSRQFTPKYQVTDKLVNCNKGSDLKNKVHYCSQEGGALFVKLSSTKENEQFDESFINKHAIKTYFPISLINLHEYILLNKALHFKFEDFTSHDETQQYYVDALKLRLNYRTLVPSQLSLHNMAHELWRDVFKLDKMHDVLAEDLRELHENSEKVKELKDDLANKLSHVERDITDLSRAKESLQKDHNFNVKAIFVSVVLAGTNVLAMNTELVPVFAWFSTMSFFLFVSLLSLIFGLSVIGRERNIYQEKQEEIIKNEKRKLKEKSNIELQIRNLTKTAN
ncbi:hypothetical protein QWY77_08275 [Thalassotalea ponticola]|uniref:hypothetical protein n=1 Tax=Thalassotalea ponticola TaxID=1523392 RepID=UPI0025B2B8C7|nr:hypothetical protein [Thalassotalea ponticola]MDN3652760.1 hypothetical protein [Thalassotalea ponticola]